MKPNWILFAVPLFAGCAAAPQPETNLQPLSYLPAASSALAFDPPVSSGEPPIDLDRAERAPSAFYGYETLTSSYYWLYQDDEQTAWGDHLQRHAVTGKSSITYR